jgi:hypothetical protein
MALIRQNSGVRIEHIAFKSFQGLDKVATPSTKHTGKAARFVRHEGAFAFNRAARRIFDTDH